ncbi:MAG: hypothetical protein CW716_11635 [Candidatus Bathyarchaeum sp.]|nr:MAG: hypothetical protein CW716_11635 [Candidatus Bathyarchaeum sp.]
MKKIGTSIILLFLAFSLCCSLQFVGIGLFPQIAIVRAEPRTIVVPDDYSTIGWAVGNASEGDTIFVKEGTYREALLIKKSLSLVGENKETTIINGHNAGPALYIQVDNVNVTGFTIINGEEPLPPSNLFPYGTRLAGIHMLSVSNCNITNNVVANSGRGIWLYNSHNIRVADNQIRDNQETGIHLESSSNSIIVGNSVESSWGGIILKDSGNNILRDNSVLNVSAGFKVSGGELSEFLNDVDFSNTIDGNAIHYLVDQKDLTINPSTYPNLDFVILVRCTNIVVENFQFTNAHVGIHLAYTDESTIMGNIITGSSVRLDYSSHNLLVNNTAAIHLESSHYNRIANSSCGLDLRRSSYNIITGNNVSRRSFGINLSFSSSDNHIEGNDIAYNTDGVFFYEAGYNNTILGNNITHSGDSGIWVEGTSPTSDYIRIIGNNITDSARWGILMRSSYGNTIVGNYIANNQNGIQISGDNGQKCHVVGNHIANNEEGIRILTQFGSEYYHNSLINNTLQVYCGSRSLSEQTWDNGYPSGGNYWSDYTGVDADNDGIGDTPYTIYENNDDNYPLMAPLMTFDAGMWEWISYSVDVISISNISSFSFDPEDTKISFSVDDEDGTAGFCRVTIPKDLLDAEGDWAVNVDGNPVNPSISSDADNSYLYFTYNHNKQTINVIGTQAIPEFPSWIILPLIIAVTLVILVWKQKLNKLILNTM